MHAIDLSRWQSRSCMQRQIGARRHLVQYSAIEARSRGGHVDQNESSLYYLVREGKHVERKHDVGG